MKDVNQIFNKVYDFLDSIIFEDTNVYLWVSWWPDSMFLFYIIDKFFEKRSLDKKNIYILHYNHNFRKESAYEKETLEEYFYNYNFIVWEYLWNNYDESSLRKARYDFFKSKIEKNWILFLWHNLTDRIETSILNMLRGCDINWFLNMKKLSENNNIIIARPLLSIEKSKITELCDILSIKYFLDKTNDDSSVSNRNFIRNNIIKELSSLSNKSSTWYDMFFSSFDNIYSKIEESYLDKSNLFKIIRSVSLPDFVEYDFLYEIDIDLSSSESIVALLKEYWAYKNVTKRQILELYNFFSNSYSWYKYLSWFYLFKAHSKFYIARWKDRFWDLNSFEFTSINKTWEYDFFGYYVFVDKEFIGWKLRFPQSWDYYNSKTLNTYFKKNNIPFFVRNFVPVIEYNWEIKKIFNNLY